MDTGIATPKMIEWGVDVFSQYDSRFDDPAGLVAAVYRAMVAASASEKPNWGTAENPVIGIGPAPGKKWKIVSKWPDQETGSDGQRAP